MAEKYSKEDAEQFFDKLSGYLIEEFGENNKSKTERDVDSFGGSEKECVFVRELLGPKMKDFLSNRGVLNAPDDDFRYEGQPIVDKKRKSNRLYYPLLGRGMYPDMRLTSRQISFCCEVKYSPSTNELMKAIGQALTYREKSKFDYGLVVFYALPDKKTGKPSLDKLKKDETNLFEKLKEHSIFVIII